MSSKDATTEDLNNSNRLAESENEDPLVELEKQVIKEEEDIRQDMDDFILTPDGNKYGVKLSANISAMLASPDFNFMDAINAIDSSNSTDDSDEMESGDGSSAKRKKKGELDKHHLAYRSELKGRDKEVVMIHPDKEWHVPDYPSKDKIRIVLLDLTCENCDVTCRACGVCPHLYSCECQAHEYKRKVTPGRRRKETACKHQHFIHQYRGGHLLNTTANTSSFCNVSHILEEEREEDLGRMRDEVRTSLDVISQNLRKIDSRKTLDKLLKYTQAIQKIC